MSKIEKIVKLITLLSNRQYTSMDKIMSTCGIPERTAYRYIQSISEANIPVTYDRDNHGYTLTSKQSGLPAGFTTGDVVMICLALRLLSTQVNAAYRAEIDELITGVSIQQECAVEDVIAAFEGSLNPAVAREPDMSSLLTSVLLHAAIQCNRKVSLTREVEANGTEPEIELQRPRLRFDRVWHVVDAAADSDGCCVALESVARVKVC